MKSSIRSIVACFMGTYTVSDEGETHRNHRTWWPCDFPGAFQGKLKKKSIFQEFPGGSQISRSFQECGNPGVGLGVVCLTK